MNNIPNDQFDIDPNVSNRLNQGMNLGGGIELPFAAPVFWWNNGNPQNRALAKDHPAMYFGGWACDAEAIEEVDKDRGGIPLGMVKTEIYTRNNKTIETYTSRSVVVAPIGFRRCWMVGQDNAAKRSIEFVAGGRQHMQVLAMLGERVESEGKISYQAWGPIVLSAKGFQVSAIQDGLKTWQKALQPVRTKLAPNVPAWGFYMALGTFGQNPETQMVGKSGAQSPITPIKLYTPQKIDDSLLVTVYVGKQTLFNMADLLDQAQPWLDAWKDKKDTGNSAEPEFDDGFIPPDSGGDDIPF